MEPALTLQVRPGVSPALLQFTGMLALSSAEVEALVVSEMAANPALERTDTPACPMCGSGAGPYCCSAMRMPRQAGGRPAETAPEGGRYGLPDWAASRTGAEELLEAVRCCATADDAALADYLIGSLDERGFLPGGPEEVAADLAIPVARVRRALSLVRRAGPPAIAARDVRESLLLQLDALNSADPLRVLARAVADRHLESLAGGRLAAVAAALGCSRDEIAAAVAYIKRYCTPSPAPDLNTAVAAARVPVVPDVLITVTGGGLRVEVVEEARLGLRVDPWYAGLAVREAGHEIREHAAGLAQRAESFIARLEDRFAAMRQVVEYTAERQRAFVLRGPRYLRPLAQADVARDLAIHESTVSRAVAGKYMMLPSRDVVPVQDFFRPALAPQDALRKLVAAEREPLTDTQLAQRLRAQGFPVARRTVAKYRHALGIAAAPLRS